MSTPNTLSSSLQTNTTQAALTVTAYRQDLINRIKKTPSSSPRRLHLQLNLLDLDEFKLKNYHNNVMNKPLPAGTKMRDVLKRHARFVEHVKFLNEQQTTVRQQLYTGIRNNLIQNYIIRAAPAEIRSKILEGQKLYGQLQAEIARGQNVAINPQRIHHLRLSLQSLYRQAVDSQRQRQQTRRSNAPSVASIEIPPPPYAAN
ncbi:uncharacterized protein EAF01_008021 [Botrytis porri]|uniref:Uncharacterized protein n=1 Tax=Botrytis porri TaxID=87229 RepID=A0A4Z1KI47_9HELO|nr:uncharacterized protein EAF01_008021 [Botrytis porri]KAF7900719.1 hypothetical protein EAF01_008021 [Botrytis porri]TGO80823.1 hypothetical protein BPOR_1680g00020 [Botrytis porri]